MISCPNCESGNVQSYQVAFESGISDIKMRSAGVLFGWGGLSAGSGRTKGTSQTALSRRTAPPRKASYIRPFILGFIASMAAGIAIPKLIILPHVVFLAVTAALFHKAHSFNTKQWPELRQVWKKSFICRKCGFSFIPNN